MIKTISQLYKTFGLYIAGIIAVGLIYFLLSGIDQGIDVVIQMGEYPAASIWSIITVVLCAYLVWYSSRFISYIKQSKDEANDGNAITIPTSYHQHFPRLLAVNCFISLQYAILCVLPAFPFINYRGWVLIGILALHNFLYFGLVNWFAGKHRSKSIPYISLLLISLTILVWICLIFHANVANKFHSSNRYELWLPIIGCLLFCMEVGMIYLFTLRRKYIDKVKTANPNNNAPSFIKPSNSRIDYFSSERNFFRWFNLISTIAISIYFTAIFSMWLSDKFGPLAFTLLALGVLVGLSNIITYFSIKFSFSVSLCLLIIAIFVGKAHNPYKVRLIESNAKNIHYHRPSVKRYFDRWIKQRESLLSKYDSANKFDVYLVLSNGGASRAGDWASNVLSSLQDSSKGRFEDHLLCIAGASGGTVGNCAFYSLLKARKDNVLKSNERFLPHDSAFFTSDFLTFTLGRMLGLDVFRHILPIRSFDDRAAALADVMAGRTNDPIVQKYFNTDIDSVFDTTGCLPFFFINSTEVEGGIPGVISATQLPDHSQRLDILDSIDRTSVNHDRSIKLSTAAVLSSRFPYVSPAGKIGNDYFVDGGYFDNSGAGIVMEFIQNVNSLLSDKSDTLYKYRSRLKFHIIHITNGEWYTRPPKDMHPLENDLITPILALVGIQSSSTHIGDRVLYNYINTIQEDTTKTLIYFSLYNRSWPQNGTYEPDYPMSWVTSDYQLSRMNYRLQQEDTLNYPMFQGIFQDKPMRLTSSGANQQ